MTRKRNRDKCGFFNNNFWQSDAYNQRTYSKNLDLLLSLAINRFRWEGLPDTCDARFLETQLHRSGIATICHKEGLPDVWQTLIATPHGEFNAYGIPVRWRADGYVNQGTGYEVTRKNGELVFYNWSRANPFNALEIYARKMTHYERTEDVNLSQQLTPWILTAPREKRLELINVLKQILGGEPAVIGDDRLRDLVEGISVLNTQVPLNVEALARGRQQVLNDALMYLGIPHLAFEKGERMIEDEARANTSPTTIALLDCLQARRQAADALNRRFGLDIHVYFNDDLESYNYNYVSNIEAQAQDKFILSGDVEVMNNVLDR